MRIAIVDSSRTVLRILQTMLEQWKHEVVTFTDGAEAIEHLRTHDDISALITSAEPTSMHGVDVVAAARRLCGNKRALYIVLMSSNSEQTDIVRALDHGADDFMQKPPQREELCARLRVAERVTAMQREIARYAYTDTLTGLANRRAFFEAAQDYCESARAGAAVSAIMLDIDHFKAINDTLGHDAGDVVLWSTAAKLNGHDALAGRLGGEEFCMLINGNMTDAIMVAEKLRNKIAGTPERVGDKTVTVTCSFGVTEWQPGDSIDRLIRRADSALYKAKHGGRNRVVALAGATIFDHDDLWPRGARGTARPDDKMPCH
ncbi:MAG TPA: diguanylate cyclase [Pseudolabrys sp.]|nr:diguanylate cyclase [Pseudolabrys sp.]